MLQGVRDNLKGTVVSSIIILFFILPMVIAGVGSSWLGSVAGTDVAVVDGRTISRSELDREIYLQKQRLLSQNGVDPSADFLKDENLRQPVLDRLTKKAAMLASVEAGGMGVSETAVNTVIVTQPEFQVEGKFDAQQYRSLISRIGLTPATYKSTVGEDIVLGQLNAGLEASSFVTEAEKASLVAIIHEKRSFYTVDIPSEGVADTVTVSDEEVQQYYADNQTQFVEPEKVSIDYVELSVNALSNDTSASDEEIQAFYDKEVEGFKESAEYQIAHILVKSDDNLAATLTEIQSKLASGETFEALAKEYSDDAGSKELGGSLGVMVANVYPPAFEAAVYQLESGQVSEPVETDSGTHLIKVVDKVVAEIPSFEDRKTDIASQIKRAKAEEIYLANLDLLGELTFNSNNLDAAAAELALEVKASQKFEKTRGIGIAGNPEIRNAAFESDVLVDGHNSRVIELAGNRAIVFRVKEHSAEHVKAFELVKTEISTLVQQNKIEALLQEKADTLVAAAKAGSDVKQLAADLGYGFALFDGASRSDPVSDPGTRSTVFSTALVDGETSYKSSANADGSFRLIGITSREAGSVDDIDTAQVTGLATQLQRENSRFEGGAYQASVVATAAIKIH